MSNRSFEGLDGVSCAMLEEPPLPVVTEFDVVRAPEGGTAVTWKVPLGA